MERKEKLANEKHARLWSEFAIAIAAQDGNVEISNDLKAALEDVLDKMNDDTYSSMEEALGAIGKAIDDHEPLYPNGVWEKLWQALKIAVSYLIA